MANMYYGANANAVPVIYLVIADVEWLGNVR